MTRDLHNWRAAGVSRPVTCVGDESSAMQPHQPADTGRSPRVAAPAPGLSSSVHRPARLPLVAVDVGNSRSKLGLFERLDDRPLPVPSRTMALANDAAELSEVAAWLAPHPPHALSWWIGSVDRDASARLVHWLRQHDCQRIVLLSSRDLPLVVSLPRPDMVGIDRLLDAVAANRLRPADRPAIVVDLGTAITVDLISAEGAFLGGTIFPGIGTSARAMHEFTDMLPLVDMESLEGPPAVLGTATVEALHAGLYWGAIGVVRELIERLAALAPVPRACCLPAARRPVWRGRWRTRPSWSRSLRWPALHWRPRSSALSSQRDPVHVVLLTPEGRGAIATLLVEGRGATNLVADVFCPATGTRLVDVPLGRIVYGRLCTANDWNEGEELVVCRRAEEELEVSCHGGTAAVARLIDLLVAGGAEHVDWRTWVRRCDDPIAAAATIALAAARTERTASILLDQLHGALRREIEAIAAALIANETDDARQRLQTLLARAKVGLHLTAPFRVVLAGRPNVGKSSLINALVGYQRAIVFDQPGTTRDVVTAVTAIDGWPVELADTAGLGESRDTIELAGMELARGRLAAADAIVLVFDSSRAWSAEDDALAAAWPDAVIVHNKCDLPPASGPERPAGIATSAVTGDGINGLLACLAARLVPVVPPPGAAAPFTPQQVAQLEAAFAAIVHGDVAKAADVLAQLGGTP